jgi:lysophospholipase L1-like esterase
MMHDTDQRSSSTGPGRHARQQGPEPRRRIPWTRVLWIALAAFGLWLLLYAPTLQRNAQASPVGTRRTVSLDILGPIAAVSRGLGLSHVVSVADGVIGRNTNVPGGGSRLITVGPRPSVASPAPKTGHLKAAAATTTTTIPTGLRPSAADPLRVLIIGDSLGIDLGQQLANDLGTTHVVSATLDGKEATGLTRPDYFNWPAELQADLPRLSPQVVVIMVGANDPQDFPGPPDIPYGTTQWDTIYAQRAQAFMAEAASAGAKVIWVGMPPMENGGLSAKMAHLNTIDQQVAQQNPGVIFLATWTLIGTPQGAYTPYLTVNGQEVNVRAPDGTHITPGGSEIISQSVLGLMRSQLHIQLPA